MLVSKVHQNALFPYENSQDPIHPLRLWRGLDAFGIPGTFSHSRQFPLILHGVEHFPFHNYHLPIYNSKQSTVNVYKIDNGRSDRVRSMG